MPASPERNPLLIVSASGRALAQSAARAGLKAVVLDLFNDTDLRGLCVASERVASVSGKFDARRLLAAAHRLCPPQRCAGLVYGSGFESRTGLLAQLARGRRLLGNAPDTVARVKDPILFSELLDSLGILHPQVRLEPPADVAGWLVKRTGGAGGSHVKAARQRHRARAQRYFQKWQAGRTLSVLFIANGREARLIGFNEQWTATAAKGGRYCYGGAVSRIGVARALQAHVAGLLARLVHATGLTGLNGLDFILDARGDAHVLEINPRPPATIELYDADAGLLSLHLRACGGELPQMPQLGRARAHAIVYAGAALQLPASMTWPQWCTDLPDCGSFIAAGAPVCSVHAEARASEAARELVGLRHASISAALLRQAA